MVDIFKEELNVSQDEKVPSIDRIEFIKVVESREMCICMMCDYKKNKTKLYSI